MLIGPRLFSESISRMKIWLWIYFQSLDLQKVLIYFLKNKKKQGELSWRTSTMGKMLPMHTEDPGLVPNTLPVPLKTTRSFL